MERVSSFIKIIIIYFYFSGITTHLVLFETENLERSKKLQHLRENKFKNKVIVVNYGWLYDTMESGSIVPVDDYLVEYWKVFGVINVNSSLKEVK